MLESSSSANESGNNLADLCLVGLQGALQAIAEIDTATTGVPADSVLTGLPSLRTIQIGQSLIPTCNNAALKLLEIWFYISFKPDVSGCSQTANEPKKSVPEPFLQLPSKSDEEDVSCHSHLLYLSWEGELHTTQGPWSSEVKLVWLCKKKNHGLLIQSLLLGLSWALR